MYWIVYGTRKGMTEKKVICCYETEKQAEEMCEQWGWTYDDGKHSYWMTYEQSDEYMRTEI